MESRQVIVTVDERYYMMEKKIIKRRMNYNPGSNSYEVIETYRGGSQSPPREASSLEILEYQTLLNGPTVISRQAEGIHNNDLTNFEQSD